MAQQVPEKVWRVQLGLVCSGVAEVPIHTQATCKPSEAEGGAAGVSPFAAEPYICLLAAVNILLGRACWCLSLLGCPASIWLSGAVGEVSVQTVS